MFKDTLNQIKKQHGTLLKWPLLIFPGNVKAENCGGIVKEVLNTFKKQAAICS
jgi:hypothetical protein